MFFCSNTVCPWYVKWKHTALFALLSIFDFPASFFLVQVSRCICLMTEVVVALFWLPRAVLCCCLGLHEARNSCKAWFPSPVNTNCQQCIPVRCVPAQMFLCIFINFNQSRDRTEAEFLDEIQTKVWRVFLLAIHSHLYNFALRFLFLQNHATSYIFLLYTVKEKGGKPGRKTYPPSLWFIKSVQKPQV